MKRKMNMREKEKNNLSCLIYKRKTVYLAIKTKKKKG